jgi:hypothetical protein
MSDTHRELYFARWDARNRLVTGGAAVFPGEGGTNLRRPVAERLKRLWPQIGDVEFDYVWSGYVGMTPDNLLHPEVPGLPVRASARTQRVRLGRLQRTRCGAVDLARTRTRARDAEHRDRHARPAAVGAAAVAAAGRHPQGSRRSHCRSIRRLDAHEV